MLLSVICIQNVEFHKYFGTGCHYIIYVILCLMSLYCVINKSCTDLCKNVYKLALLNINNYNKINSEMQMAYRYVHK